MKYIKKHCKYLISLRYIKLFSYWSARSLQQKLNTSTKHKYMYYYGFQILFGAINKGLLLITAGLILNILPQLLIATLAFMLLRVFIGGLHFDSYTKCAWVSLASLITIGLLSKYVPYYYPINLVIFSTLFIIILKFAPIEHKNRLITKSQGVRFKITALVIEIVLFGTQLLLNNNNINNSIMYGVLLSGIIALPILNKRSNTRETKG